MFKTILVTALMLFAVGAMAGEKFPPVPDADAVIYNQHVAVAADTLWFVESGATHWSTHADWYGPQMVPFNSSGGGLQFENRRAKWVYAFSEEPFSMKLFMPYGAAEPSGGDAGWTYVDTTNIDGIDAGAGELLTRFPCHFLIEGYPDSVYFKEGGTDTVRLHIGY